jgi:hypothetical protein
VHISPPSMLTSCHSANGMLINIVLSCCTTSGKAHHLISQYSSIFAAALSFVDAQLLDAPIRYEALTPADASAMTAEARMRLLSGLKRFFHSKRAEGLVSGQVFS